MATSIDLTAATNVHILEPHWNPIAEAQAVDRVHRISQTKDVTVVRYLTANTVEMVRFPERARDEDYSDSDIVR